VRKVAHGTADIVGVVLSGATSMECECQLLESAEKGKVREGMLIIVKSQNRNILARISQIVPYNDFYTEGDAFSEPRRRGLPIPDDVARKYEICKMELLMELPRAEVRYPPAPGDPVVRLDPLKDVEQIFGVSSSQAGYVAYGTLVGYENLEVPLNVSNVTMHLAVFGVTGSGKSYNVGALIEKLVCIPTQNNEKVSYPMIMIDAHGDYTDYVEHVEKKNKLGEIGWIRRYVFPKAYENLEMRREGSLTQPIGINLDSISPRELAELIILYYKGTTEGSELSVEGINVLFENMAENGYESRHNIFVHHFDDLLTKLEQLEKEVISLPTKAAIARALQTFKSIEEKHNLLSVKSDLKEGVTFVDRITREGGIAILDFSADGAPGVDLKTKQFVMAYLATVLFEQFTNYKIRKEDRYLLFIIEEAQNFVPDKSYPIGMSLASNKLSAIATQGRKFGLSLCLISQRPSFVDRIVLSMCNTFFIHRVSPEDVYFVKNVTGGLPASIATRLTNLDTGDLILTGQMCPTPFPLLLHVRNSDRSVPHTIGRTDPISSLTKLRGLL
jgi:DNA helicase HerA-like ATPase